MKNARLITALFVVALPALCWGKKNKEAPDSHHATQVLIIGLNDNVKSNYYYDEMIAEATGMKADSIDQQYNSIISQNIVAAAANSSCKFIAADDPIAEKIGVNGEAENCKADLSGISTEELKQALDKAQAEYLLVLNRHYLKWQDQPMRTIFHIVCYTLYDKDKKQVYSGSQYFTSMDLESPKRLMQLSRKSSAKIASAIAGSIEL